MIAEQLINEMIPPLKPCDTGKMAKNWMEELRINQLPVVDKNHYQGLLTDEVLMESGSLDRKISDYKLNYKDLFVTRSTHYYDILKLALRNKLQILPVLNEEKIYMGVVSVYETTAAVAQMFASQGPGAIILLSMKEQDYSMAQISRLIEANEVKILSSFVVTDETNPNYINLTLKLNKTDVARTVATLERYNYNVVAQFSDDELISNDKERLDMLMKYLNI
ncbi:MAG: CBS domain-containing protein [Cytophagaceae bacterium]|nr:CBS domain-containing protein [Cytophagaceae bacterium]MDW8457107.1 CBS domain-containing protein [Cytophagaceae bacterium]